MPESLECNPPNARDRRSVGHRVSERPPLSVQPPRGATLPRQNMEPSRQSDLRSARAGARIERAAAWLPARTHKLPLQNRRDLSADVRGAASCSVPICFPSVLVRADELTAAGPGVRSNVARASRGGPVRFYRVTAQYQTAGCSVTLTNTAPMTTSTSSPASHEGRDTMLAVRCKTCCSKLQQLTSKVKVLIAKVLLGYGQLRHARPHRPQFSFELVVPFLASEVRTRG